jgi:arginine N-succinyltransferase
MVVIRPVADGDLEGLFDLAGLAGVGLTTLPRDRALLGNRIRKSLDSFKTQADRPAGESYLLVMEDCQSRRVVGTCGIVSKVGGFEPFYSYKVESVLFESKVINVRREVPILRLEAEHDGPCEIGSLFLHPEFRHNGNGRMLQLVRFLFMAEHPERFESTVVSEIRGQLDEQGHSPFWDALGRHFFGMDFAEADRLSVVNKKFIAELMPRHPIYIPLLSAEAQALIGKPHHDSERAVRNLEMEGFKFANAVDIFDAGPVLSCPRDQIRTVARSRRATVAAIVETAIESPKFLLGTTAEHFRACGGRLIQRTSGGVVIESTAAKALEVKIGDAVRFVELNQERDREVAKAR